MTPTLEHHASGRGVSVKLSLRDVFTEVYIPAWSLQKHSGNASEPLPGTADKRSSPPRGTSVDTAMHTATVSSC